MTALEMIDILLDEGLTPEQAGKIVEYNLPLINKKMQETLDMFPEEMRTPEIHQMVEEFARKAAKWAAQQTAQAFPDGAMVRKGNP